MNTITVNIKSNYGALAAYPACPNAARFAARAGTKTLTLEALQTIKALGFEVIQKTPQTFQL